jgi:hypothetical protein
VRLPEKRHQRRANSHKGETKKGLASRKSGCGRMSSSSNRSAGTKTSPASEGEPRAMATIRTDEREKPTRNLKEAGGLHGAKRQPHSAQNSGRPVEPRSPRTQAEQSLGENAGVESSEHRRGREPRRGNSGHTDASGHTVGPQEKPQERHRPLWPEGRGRDTPPRGWETLRTARTGQNAPGPSELPYPRALKGKETQGGSRDARRRDGRVADIL